MISRDVPQVTAAQLAAFDQAYAHSSKVVDDILEAHRANVQRLSRDDLPEAAAIFGLSRYLLEDLTFEAVVSIATVAIVRIDRALREGGR